MAEVKQEISEYLRIDCPNCKGTGKVLRPGYEKHDLIPNRCSVCHGSGKIWALDQQEMAERIAALDAVRRDLIEIVERYRENHRNEMEDSACDDGEPGSATMNCSVCEDADQALARARAFDKEG